MKKELRLQTLAMLDQISAEEFNRHASLLHEHVPQPVRMETGENDCFDYV